MTKSAATQNDTATVGAQWIAPEACATTVGNGWRECKLHQIANYKTGKLNSNAATEKGIYPFFTCSPQTLKIDNYAFDEEALLLAGNNANGIFSIKYFKGKFNAYQRTYIISTNESYKFLYYALSLQLASLEGNTP